MKNTLLKILLTSLGVLALTILLPETADTVATVLAEGFNRFYAGVIGNRYLRSMKVPLTWIFMALSGMKYVFRLCMGKDQRWIEHADVYHPINPKDSPLWHLLDDHYERFEQHDEERFAREYGFFRSIISEVVRDYLKCGELKEGFARVRCPGCKVEYLWAFSCRGRWFCPSCHAKKVILFGEHLRHDVLFPVPHSHYVFSLPIIIRRFFKYDRGLLSRLCNCVNESLLAYLRTVIGLSEGLLGAVMTIHTFGDFARKWHSHIHLIVADGLFTRNGTFYVMPRGGELRYLAEIFRAKVLSMLKKEGQIGDEFI